MTIEVDIDGKVHAVTIDATGVSVDGVVSDVALTALGDGRVALLVGRRSVDALVAETGRPGELTIHVAGQVFAARVFARGRVWGARRRAGASESAATGRREIVAPMPGRIARVLVSPGAQVQARQPLLVIEAMKMENELRASAASLVKEVMVAEGMLVEAGRVLVVLES